MDIPLSALKNESSSLVSNGITTTGKVKSDSGTIAGSIEFGVMVGVGLATPQLLVEKSEHCWGKRCTGLKLRH
jgi:hypothetical protein